jgi:hypothetical protein
LILRESITGPDSVESGLFLIKVVIACQPQANKLAPAVVSFWAYPEEQGPFKTNDGEYTIWQQKGIFFDFFLA